MLIDRLRAETVQAPASTRRINKEIKMMKIKSMIMSNITVETPCNPGLVFLRFALKLSA
jgi:hypothetical protein